MMGLILKDLLCMRKVLKSYALILAVYVVLAVTGIWSVSFLAGFLIVIVSMLPFTCFSFDHAAKWDAYGLALPVSRNRTVAARYLSLLLFMAAAVTFSLLLGLVILALGRESDFYELLFCCGICLSISALLNTIQLPLLYRFGAERARIIFFALSFGIGGLAALSAVTLVMLEPEETWLDSALVTVENILNTSPWLIAVCAAAICAALLGVSFLISCAIFKRKEM